MSRTTAALTDRATVVRAVRSGGKVEGRSLVADVHQAQCRARLVLDATVDGQDAEGQRRVLQTGRLVLAGADDQADEVLVNADDRVEVSGAGETTMWRVRSVEAVRRRRRLIGTICMVERVEDQRVESVSS